MILTLVAVTLVALHKRYKRKDNRVPQQPTSKPQMPEMESSPTMPQELATGSWVEHGVSAREGAKELEGPNFQRVEMRARESVAQEMKARESVAQEMKARESVAKELDVEAMYGDMGCEEGPSNR